MILLQLLCLQMVLAQAVTANSTEALLEVIYWEVKPFIFTNDEGQIDGIIPKMLEEAQYYCMNNPNVTAVLYRFALKTNSRKKFYDLIRSNASYGNDMLQNISKEKSFWAPVLSNKDKRSKAFEKNKGLLAFQLVKSNHIAVIVPRSYISLPTKILRGILKCGQIFLLACLMSALLSMIMWFLEHSNNDSVPDSFIKGIGTTLWWSFVSMTTVGYGDVVPKSIIGRCVAILWIFTGVMIACVMTATMTDEVSGIGGMNLHGEKVTVLENSYEKKVAANDYGANVTPVESYEMVIEKVRNGDAFAGMINADVAAWYQHEIHNHSSYNPLSIVKILPGNLYVDCYVSAKINPNLEKVFKCMYVQQEEVYKASIESFKRYCKIEVLYIGSMREFIQHNKFIQILIWIVLGLFLAGLLYEVFRYKFGKVKTEKMKTLLYCNIDNSANSDNL